MSYDGQGTNGYGNITQGSGKSNTFSPGVPGDFGSINIQVFTSSGTYTPTTNMLQCMVEVQADGGGGGGANSSNAPPASGGGGGEYRRGTFTAATIGGGQTITIGTGGSGGTAGANGTAGTGSSFGTLITCVAGSGGLQSASGVVVLGGAGGSGGTGGSVIIPGQRGEDAASSGSPFYSGAGGDAFYGSGAQGRIVLSSAQTNGRTGQGFGSGGSGAAAVSSGTANGGAGAPGIIIVTEYISA